MNKLTQLFENKNKASAEALLSVYFTAGFPNLDDTIPVLNALEESGVDMVEIGIPFSDPVADGETIQRSNQKALENGMTVARLMSQLKGTRLGIPVLLMGYLNPVLQYGIEKFCAECEEIGISGLILPDLPLDEFEKEYQGLFKKHNLLNIFLITPQTPEKRIRRIDSLSSGFVYMVSSAGVTGATSTLGESTEAYFARVESLGLRNPRMVGFGIHDEMTFKRATTHAHGAIVGSAFIKVLEQQGIGADSIQEFVSRLKPNKIQKQIV